MSEDRRVTGRSDEEVRRIAENAKSEYGVSRRRPVNIVRCLESGSVPTIYGRKKLVFRIVEDDDPELGDAAAKTEFAKGVVTITAKRGVRDRAQAGSGRDRMTLAHELGHAVFHHGTPLFRLLNATGSTKLAEEKAYESAEHQAKIFAAAFLIHDDDAAKMRGAEEISVEFLVSLEAARICFERLAKKLERSKSAERVRKLADETRAILSGNSTPKKVVYLDSLCGTCHQQTLLPIANKVLCDTCGFIGDGFQDGDPL